MIEWKNMCIMPGHFFNLIYLFMLLFVLTVLSMSVYGSHWKVPTIIEKQIGHCLFLLTQVYKKGNSVSYPDSLTCDKFPQSIIL